MSHLPPEKVEEIQRLWKTGEWNKTQIAREVGTSSETVRRWVQGIPGGLDGRIDRKPDSDEDRSSTPQPMRQLTDRAAVLVHRPGAPSEVHFQSEDREALRELEARYGVEPVKVKKLGSSGARKARKAASVSDEDWDWEKSASESKPLWRIVVPSAAFYEWSTRDLPSRVTKKLRKETNE